MMLNPCQKWSRYANIYIYIALFGNDAFSCGHVTGLENGLFNLPTPSSHVFGCCLGMLTFIKHIIGHYFITLFRSIAMFYGSDNVLQKFLVFSMNGGIFLDLLSVSQNNVMDVNSVLALQNVYCPLISSKDFFK